MNNEHEARRRYKVTKVQAEVLSRDWHRCSNKLTVTNGQNQELQSAEAVGRLQHGEPVVPEGVWERRHDILGR
jgi:hypothetical protein